MYNTKPCAIWLVQLEMVLGRIHTYWRDFPRQEEGLARDTRFFGFLNFIKGRGAVQANLSA